LRPVTFFLGESRIIPSSALDSIVILNPTASRVWELLEQGQEPESIANRLATQFALAPEIARQDLDPVFRLWSAEEFPCSIQEKNGFAAPTPVDPLNLEQDRQPASCKLYALTTVPFSIEFHSSEIESIFQAVLGHRELDSSMDPCARFAVRIDGAGYCLIKNGCEVARENSPHSLRHALVYEIAKASYPENEWLVFMHAGAVLCGQHAIVLPGVPCCGKSTLTSALTWEGLSYLSEDVVPISRHGWKASPVPTRICLREGGFRVLNGIYPDIQFLPGGRRGGEQLRYWAPPKTALHPLPVCCMLFPEYSPGHPFEINDLSDEEKLVRLMRSGAWFSQSIDKDLIQELLAWIQATPGYLLRYGDLKEAVSRIKSWLTQ
jgi:hypothetical protein